ncbi:MAG: uracil-DNA glycosylase family protein [Bacteriovoracia bacterium]
MSTFDKKPQPPETFAEALMGDLDLSHLAPVRPVAAQTALTEKAVILESFTQFAEDALAQAPAGVVSFPGGELAQKESTRVRFSPSHASIEAWAQAQEIRATSRVWRALTDGKQALSVLFIGEALRGEEALDAEITGIRPEFLVSFIPPVADLFQKMVQAMKLGPSEFALSALQDAKGERSNDDLLEEIFWRKPRFVVPLGARATQTLLGARERLATVHGKFFALDAIPDSDTQVVPLFHPSVIASNANMKKSTWVDMQKIMQALGKV